MISVLKDDDALEMKSARKRNGGILPNNHTAPTAEVSEKRQQRHAEVKYPDYLMSSFLSFLVFVMAATMRGMLRYIHVLICTYTYERSTTALQHDRSDPGEEVLKLFCFPVHSRESKPEHNRVFYMITGPCHWTRVSPRTSCQLQ